MAIKVISDDPIQALVNIHALKNEKKPEQVSRTTALKVEISNLWAREEYVVVNRLLLCYTPQSVWAQSLKLQSTWKSWYIYIAGSQNRSAKLRHWTEHQFKKMKRIQNGSHHILCDFSIFSDVFVVMTTTKSVLAS